MLDVGLPDIDGFEVCRRLRADGVWAPILMLTARDAVEDRVDGLDTGADDYLLKPFTFDELPPGCARSPAAAHPSGRRCSRRAACGWTPPPARPGAARPSSTCPRRSSPCSRR